MWRSISRRLGPRLTLGSAGFIVAAVPVTLLAFLAVHGWAPLHRLDQGAADSLHGWAVRTPAAVGTLQLVSTVLHPWVLRALAAVVALVLLRRRRSRLALWLAVTVVGAGLLGLVLKEVVRRSRPHLPGAVASASGWSFPSGHALNSFVVLGALLLLSLPLLSARGRVAAWLLTVAAVLLVGFSRVALGVHFVSDVVAGWLLGLGWLAMTVAAFEAWRAATGRRVPEVLEESLEPEPEPSPVPPASPAPPVRP